MTGEFGPWLQRFHPAAESAVRLFCFPHAGGTAASYIKLSLALAPDLEVLAVQYPGRQDRFDEPCVDSIDRLADLAADALLDLVGPARAGGRPFALFGHSMGATLAFEVALRLERAGAPALALIASGQAAPSLQAGSAARLSDDETLLAGIRKLGQTDPRVLDDAGLLRLIFPAIRADHHAAEGYRYTPGPPLQCPVSVLIGESDPDVTMAGARAWRRHTNADFAFGQLPGGHFYLKQHTEGVAARITEAIAVGRRNRIAEAVATAAGPASG